MGLLNYSGDLDADIPFYVTRKDASDNIYTWSIVTRSAVRLLVLAQAAATLWLFIAILAAVAVLVGVPVLALIALL